MSRDSSEHVMQVRTRTSWEHGEDDWQGPSLRRGSGLAIEPPNSGITFSDHALSTQPRCPNSTELDGTEPVQAKAKAKAGRKLGAASMAPPGNGVPLPDTVRNEMEAAFETDFSSVRVHEDNRALALGAIALTQGSDIYFAPGQYRPDQQQGRELLGHELAHVDQQSRGRVPITARANGFARNDDPLLEKEADDMGARAARGRSARESSRGQAFAEPADSRDVVSGDAARSTSSTVIQCRRNLMAGEVVEYRGDVEGVYGVWSMSVRDWQKYLKEEADERVGSTRLLMFMAKALGWNSFSSADGDVFELGLVLPVERSEAVDLMVAFLTVGDEMDLPDYVYWMWGGEGTKYSAYSMGPLMAEFTAEFSSDAIRRLSLEKTNLKSDDYDNIKAYAGAAADMKNLADHADTATKATRDTLDPSKMLIVSALGTAVGATISVDTYGKSGDEQEKYKAICLIRDAGKVIAASIEQAKEAHEAQIAKLKMIFGAVAGIVAVGPSKVVQVAIAALTPVVEHFLDKLDAGSAEKLRAIKDEFTDCVTKLVNEGRYTANDAIAVESAFHQGLDYMG